VERRNREMDAPLPAGIQESGKLLRHSPVIIRPGSELPTMQEVISSFGKMAGFEVFTGD
jgi:hypothetical protein